MENEIVSSQIEGRIAVIIVDNPPVNALSHAVRGKLGEEMRRCAADDAIDGIVLACAGRTFIAGADIKEFGAPSREPVLPDLIGAIEAIDKPVVAAIHGTAMGGGFEVTLGCHFRVALRNATLGLPEVKLGLVPGAGGTQRLPRLIGPEAALKPIVTGAPIPAIKALELGMLDALFDEDLLANAIAFAGKLIEEKSPLRRVSRMTEMLEPARTNPQAFEEAANKLLSRTRGLEAPAACVESVRNTLTMSFGEGTRFERQLFLKLRDGEQSKAQRHLFFAQRAAAKIPGLPSGTQRRQVENAVVLGAGTMGSGIAMAFASAGIPVTLIDLKQEALERGMDAMRANYEKTAARGGMSEKAVRAALSCVTPAGDFNRVADADLIIEAVFEDMALKRRVFADLDRIARPGAILATNTSYLDVNEIAGSTGRPQDVLGMHFFSPANVMKLLEVVRAEKTAPDALLTAVDMGRRIGKVPVVVGMCYGFVGNRMLAARNAQVERLLLEGAMPKEVDAAATAFGFAMGPCAVSDLAGLDIGWRARKEAGRRAVVADAICELGRFGQKTGRGYYLYENGSRKPIPDPQIEALIADLSAKESIARRPIDETEISERLVFPLINEGAHILKEGIAVRASDIDLIWVNGYGWPIAKGGPMYHADRIGLAKVAERLQFYADLTGDETLWPSPLLARLARDGGTFAEATGTGQAA